MRSPLRRNSLARIRGNVFRSGARLQWWPRPKLPPTAAAGPTASGSITLGGTASASAAPTSAGTITLGGSATGVASPTATGSITLGGSATASARPTASGSITLGGAPSGTALLPAPSAATLRADALGNDGLGGSTTTDIVIPADAATDGTDYAVVTIAGFGAVVSSAPSGWNLLLGPTAVSSYNSYLYGKTIAPGEPGTTVSWTFSVSTVAPGHMAVYRNVNPTGILVGTPTVDTTSGTTLTIPTVASVPAGALFHVHFADINDNTPPASLSFNPSGYTLGASSRSAASASFKNAVQAVYKVTSSAGTYGGETAQFTSAFMRGAVYAVALPAALPVAGSITLGGTATATAAAPSTTGSISLGGTSTATAPATTAGSISLDGAPAATAQATTTGTVTLSGTATGTTPGVNTAAGVIVLDGTPTATVPATTTGLITLSGLATAQAVDALLSHIPGTAFLSPAEATAILGDTGAGTASLAYQPGTASLADTEGVAVITGYVPGTAVLSPAAALALVNTT